MRLIVRIMKWELGRWGKLSSKEAACGIGIDYVQVYSPLTMNTMKKAVTKFREQYRRNPEKIVIDDREEYWDMLFRPFGWKLPETLIFDGIPVVDVCDVDLHIDLVKRKEKADKNRRSAEHFMSLIGQQALEHGNIRN